ncbi:MAG: MlaD family protein [Daejeonella sp.]|uniref:MlaD family protein n=1 Tax=Daejeonella sp. TaxID=2805397 RepID=UPI0027371719|nr:MlaD family protein [Daejeonella sp.]MDP3468428.1 MlaD family protein [Daejeonella sp.]
MAKKIVNSVRLGIFVLSGLAFLILLLFMIGRNKSLFGSTYVLKAKFENVQGLIPGNNVRYSGIQSGTVRNIKIVNDTIIEVSMMIDTEMQDIIRKDAIASIGTDGIVGNKVVNIVPGKGHAELAREGDVIFSKKPIDTDAILQKLSNTNNDISEIVSGLKITVERVNSSTALWELLNDETIPKEIRQSAVNLRLTTSRAGMMADDLHTIIADMKAGKGSVGVLLKDTAFAYNLNEAVLKMNKVGSQADRLTNDIGTIVKGIQQDVNSGKGPANAFLKDSVMVKNLNSSIDNLRKGTDGFNQNMEALKRNFLLRGYFKRQERQKQAEKPNP